MEEVSLYNGQILEISAFLESVVGHVVLIPVTEYSEEVIEAAMDTLFDAYGVVAANDFQVPPSFSWQRIGVQVQ